MFKVICLKSYSIDDDRSYCFIKDNIYEVRFANYDNLHIIDEDGYLWTYNYIMRNFISLSQLRKEKLEKLKECLK